jgi:nitrite reductase/ring-hydroxylating ferredoxin subunit
MDLIADQVQVREIRRHLVGVVKIGGQIYVFDGRCPHAGRSLEGCEVTAYGLMKCPAHGFQLSLTPQPCSVNAIPLTSLTCRVRDGIVEVDRGALRRKRAGFGAGI